MKHEIPCYGCLRISLFIVQLVQCCIEFTVHVHYVYYAHYVLYVEHIEYVQYAQQAQCAQYV